LSQAVQRLDLGDPPPVEGGCSSPSIIVGDDLAITASRPSPLHRYADARTIDHRHGRRAQ
ncbi:MAG: hypothetical protein V9F00_08215, partial [Nocardioides sp.]